MSSIEPIAVAFVEIRPDPKSVAAFGAQLRKDLLATMGTKPFVIPIVPELATYKARIQTELRATSFVIPVTPFLSKASLAKFEAQLKTAAAGAVVPVQIAPTQAAVGAAGAAAVPAALPAVPPPAKTGPLLNETAAATGNLTAAEKARNAELAVLQRLQSSVASSEALYAATLDKGLSSEVLANRVSQARAVNLNAIKNATVISTSTEARYTDAMRSQAAETLRELRALEEKIALRSTEIRTTSAAATAETRAAEAAALQANVQERLNAIQTQGLAATVAATGADKAQAAANALVSDARKVRNAVTKTGTTAEIQQAEADLALATTMRTLVGVQIKLNEVEHAGAGTTSELAKNRAELAALNRVAGSAGRAVTAAEETEIPIAEELAGALQLLVTARRNEAIAAVKQAAADAEASKLQAGITRGFGARAGTAAGLRGATLAAGAPFLIGTAAATGLFLAAKAAADFQKSLLQIQQVSGATTAELDQINTVAKEMGKSLKLPQVSAVESAKAIDILTHSGLNLVDAAHAARGALVLAAGGQISLEDSTKATVEVLRAFRLEATQSVAVADALTNASQATHASMTEIVAAFDAVGPVASRSGLSFQSTVALLDQLIEGGTDASRAASQLRQSLLRLEAPSTTAQKAFHKLRISEADLVDTAGNVKPDAFVILGKALEELDKREGLTAKQAAILNRQLLAQIFSARAVQGALILTGQGAEGLRHAQEEMGKTGTAMVRAQVEAKTFAGQVDILKTNLSNLALQVGPTLLSSFSAFVNGLSTTATLISTVGRVSGDAAGQIDKFLGEQFSIPGVSDKTNKGLGDMAKSFAIAGFKIADFANPLIAFPNIIKGLNAIDPASKKVQSSSDLIAGSIQKISDQAKKAGILGVGPFVKFLQQLQAQLEFAGPKGEAAAKVIKQFVDEIQKTGEIPVNIGLKIKAQIDAADALASGKAEMAGVFNRATIDVTPTIHVAKFNITGLENAVKAAQAQIDIQTIQAGGVLSPQAQLAIDKQTEAAQRAIVAAQAKRAAANPNATGALRKARADLAATLRDEAQQRAAIAAQGKQAAQDARTAQDKADQAEIDRFNASLASTQNKLTIAAAKNQLQRELKLNEDLLAAYKKEEHVLAKRIKDKKTRANFLAQIKAQEAQLTATIININQQIAQAQQAAFQSKVVDILELRIQIAETNGQTKLEERLLHQEINAFNKQLARLKKQHAGIKAILSIQLQIAEAKAKLRDLQNKNNAADFSKLSFAFLTEQQGIFSNFGSNFFPQGALAVGGTSGATPTPTTPRLPTPIPSANKGKGVQAATDLLRERAGIGISHAQANELVHLMRQLVKEMQQLRKGAGHPSNRHSEKFNQSSSVGPDHSHG